MHDISCITYRQLRIDTACNQPSTQMSTRRRKCFSHRTMRSELEPALEASALIPALRYRPLHAARQPHLARPATTPPSPSANSPPPTPNSASSSPAPAPSPCARQRPVPLRSPRRIHHLPATPRQSRRHHPPPPARILRPRLTPKPRRQPPHPAAPPRLPQRSSSAPPASPHNKSLALRDLAAKTLDGTVPTLARIRRMSDEAIIDHLTQVRGIGRWTVEMLLIFRLGRPDVLPIQRLRRPQRLRPHLRQAQANRQSHPHGPPQTRRHGPPRKKVAALALRRQLVPLARLRPRQRLQPHPKKPDRH